MLKLMFALLLRSRPIHVRKNWLLCNPTRAASSFPRAETLFCLVGYHLCPSSVPSQRRF